MSDFEALRFAPGLVPSPSPALMPGRWHDGQLVRWRGGFLRPIAGWVAYLLDTAIATPIRAIHEWVDNDGEIFTGVLCDNNAYVIAYGAVTEITPADGLLGPDGAITDGGFGDDTFGTGTYGTPRTRSTVVKPVGPAFTLDNYGEDLLLMSSYDGRLLRWSPSVYGAVAEVVPNAPVNNRFFVSTNERHVMLFGMGGSLNSFGWCSQEDITDWNFASVTNTAGQYDIEPASDLISAVRIKAGILIFTSDDAYLVTYEGTPYIYSYASIANAAVPISYKAVANYGGNAVWYTDGGFWVFDGATATPLPSDMQDYIRENIDPTSSRFRAFAVNIQSVNEVWFFFCLPGAQECSLLIVWNFADGWWSKGTLTRTAGFKSSYTTYPTFSDGLNVFLHENGQSYPGAALPWVQSTALSTKDGAIKGTLVQCLLDVTGAYNNLRYTFVGRNRSNPDVVPNNIKGPLTARADGYLDIRITARDIQMRIDSVNAAVNDWSVGVIEARVAPAGAR